MFDLKLLTSTMKRPVGSPSTAMSKNTRGNPIFLVAKLRRHNWIKLDWLAKWFWLSVCRRPIERACRHSVPATREAIFLHVLCACASVCVRVDNVMVLMRRVWFVRQDEKSTGMNEYCSMCASSDFSLSTHSLQNRRFTYILPDTIDRFAHTH